LKEKLSNDMHFDSKQLMYHVAVGGVKDKLKADWDGQRFEHLRVAKFLNASHTKKAEKQLVEMLAGKLPDGETPCMCAGSQLGCLRDTCPYNHSWVGMLTEAQMKRAKLYYAWCLAKADGTTHQQNVDWMTEAEAKTQKSRRLALTKKVVKLLRDAGFGPHAAP
jgi:hypothetical protein